MRARTAPYEVAHGAGLVEKTGCQLSQMRRHLHRFRLLHFRSMTLEQLGFRATEITITQMPFDRQSLDENQTGTSIAQERF